MGTSGSGGPLAFAAFQDNDSTAFACAEGTVCRLGNDDVARFMNANPDGWSEPFTVGDVTIAESAEVTAAAATVTIDDMVQQGFDDDTDFTYFAADAGAIMDYIVEPADDLSNGFVGLNKNESTYAAGCEYDLFRPGLSWTEYYMEFPTDVDIKASGGGLRWEWSFVEYSRDCYEWRSWANDKDGRTIGQSTVYGFETNRYSNIPHNQVVGEDIAELCINVTGVTWLDQTWYPGEGRRAYWGQNHPFHPEPRSNGDVCVPMARNWGDTNCDGKVDFDDIAGYVSREIIFENIGIVPNSECSTAFARDVNWDGVVDVLDGEFIFDCLMKAKDGITTEECSRLNIKVEGSTNPEPPEPPTEPGEDPTVPATENGSTATGTANGVPFGPFDFGPEGGPVPVPADATGKICISVSEKGAPGTDTPAGTTTTCYLTPPQPTLSVDGAIATATWPDIDTEIGSQVQWYHDPASDTNPDNDVPLHENVPIEVTSSSSPTTSYNVGALPGSICFEAKFKAPQGVDDSVWSNRVCTKSPLPTPALDLTLSGTVVTASWPAVDGDTGSTVIWYYDEYADANRNNDALIQPGPIPLPESDSPSASHDVGTNQVGAICAEVQSIGL